jgi:hypothetical protein
VLSVILPYRDAAETIDEAVASVLADACDEVVAVDDGSRDDGPRRVAAIAARDRRVVRVATGGLGIVGALRAGVAAARGDLLARMDADDVSLAGRLAAAAARLEADGSLGAVATQVELGVGAPEGLARYVAWQNELVDPAAHLRDRFVEATVCHPSVVLRRAALEAVGGYADPPWPEDWDLWLRLHEAGWGIAKVPRVLFRWQHRPGRLTFSSARYAPPRLVEVRAAYLAPRLAAVGPFVVWGAGATGRHLARALEAHGLAPRAFVDIDPRKIGRAARGRPIVSADDHIASSHRPFTVVAVGAAGARHLVRARLCAEGAQELRDFVCAA